ncbi:MAG TPA: hypothetical protein VFJ02_25860, partial [Vicinamibacterales bacterium]|nr:hypothetical protein [Vicinamibacterales bacterium]
MRTSAVAAALAACTVGALTGTRAGAAPQIQVETLKSVAGLPAHIAGRFNDITACHQLPDGAFLVFDRRSQTVFSVPPGADAPVEIVKIGAEPGRIIQPYAFDVAPSGMFVV